MVKKHETQIKCYARAREIKVALCFKPEFDVKLGLRPLVNSGV
jgi:hypothetical protein